MTAHTLERILKKRLIPAVTIHNAEDALPLAEAMLRANLDVIEITFRTAAAEEAIRHIAERYPQMLLGAGTILSMDQLSRAADAGCRFTVAPGFRAELVAAAHDRRVLHVPGTITPTEIEEAMAAGCKLLKFFPADAMGGARMLKAYSGPYGHTGVKFAPTGGINSSNASEFLAMPIVGAVGGSWMAPEKLIKERNWAEISRLCMEAVSLCAVPR